MRNVVAVIRFGILPILLCGAQFLSAQPPIGGPTNEKAQRTFQEALDLERKHQTTWALDSFKKADKQDGGHCITCQKKMVKYGIELQEWKTAETASDELIAEAQSDEAVAVAHYHFGRVLLAEGIDRKKDELFSRAHEEMTKALAARPNFPEAIYVETTRPSWAPQGSPRRAARCI